jgi:hypothetical protein
MLRAADPNHAVMEFSGIAAMAYRYLVEIFLPLFDNAGKRLPKKLFADVRAELVERCGGLTAYTRAPATGLWKQDKAAPVRDDLVIYEVMTARLDVDWWSGYRVELEARFRQDAIVMRAQRLRLL